MENEDEWSGAWDISSKRDEWGDTWDDSSQEDEWGGAWDDFSHDYSSFVSRILASKIDSIAIGIIFIILFFTVIIMSTVDVGFLFNFYFLPFYMLFFIFAFIYFTILESAFGTTVGKSFAGIRVIQSNGDKPSMRTSMIRNLERLIWPIPIIGQIILYFSVKCIENDKQRWGDQMADTFVVSKPMKLP